MEPDPSPEPILRDTQITNKDIDQILGISKKKRKNSAMYVFSKRVIIAVASLTTFVYLSIHYFNLI